MKKVIHILEPRYNDRRVLVARWRIPAGGDIFLAIQKGAYKGLYKATNKVICASPIEPFTAKSGVTFQVRAIAINELERMGDEEV